MLRSLLLASLVLLVVNDGALAKGGARTACPGGRFMADAPLVAADAAGAVDVGGGTITIGGSCVSATAAVKRTRHGTLVRAVWPACGGLAGRVRLRAMIRTGCATLVGVLRARHHRQHFVATRQPECGNGILEGREECDASGCCAADCRRSTDPSCPGDRACTADAECAGTSTGGAYCARPAGQCDAPGVCRPTGAVCTASVDPVCGCDGSTYPNACEAGAHGVNVASPGSCDAPVCGTIAGLTCGDGQRCELLPGECGVADAAGRCIDVPASCLGILDPVCGCDGNTYVNDCFRQQAGVQEAHDGHCRCRDLLCSPDTKPVDTDGDGCSDACRAVCDEPCDCLRDPALPLPRPCPIACTTTGACGGFWTCEDHLCVERCGPIPGDVCPPPLCTSNDDCASGAFCDARVGQCEAPGTCAPRPEGCPDVFAPVCGCDGTTYPSRCDAAGHGVRTAHAGPCDCAPPPCAAVLKPVDTDGDGCPDTCIRRCHETCDCYKDAPEFSEPCPLECAACGNFWTCEEGACREHCGPIPPGNDECKTPPGFCTTNDDCAGGQYCACGLGMCAGPGICVERPDVCTRELAPVCGCDGQTYSNPCLAAVAGVRVAASGACGCHDVTCPDGTAGVDSDGDGCTDRCRRPCADPCDCGPLPLAHSFDVCPLAALCPAPLCGSFWTCEDGFCVDHCGVVPPGTDVCPVPGSCASNDDCKDGELCLKLPGGCAGRGTCVPRPEVCPEHVEQVCGCDGKTYTNACDALAAGVSVAARGACDPATCAAAGGCTVPGHP